MEREARGVHQTRGATGGGPATAGAGSSSSSRSPDFVLQWGSRKRLRCVKIQVKAAAAAAGGSAERRATTVRVDRRVVRSAADKELSCTQQQLLRRTSSPSRHRILRNSESVGGAMRSPQRQTIAANGHHDDHHHRVGLAATRSGAGPRNGNGFLDDLAHLHHHSNGAGGFLNGYGNNSKISGLSSSGSEGRAFVWPKFEIALSNKEKEEDFFVFKGCTKLPQRPKKRAKCIQKTLNLVCPGTWLCDLTQERYEVREKKVSKKRPRGLKAMGGSMESDSD